MGDKVANIDELRGQINNLDIELVELLARRLNLCRAVGRAKRDANVPMMQPSRIVEVIQRVQGAGARYGLSPEFLEQMWRSIIDEACRLEDSDSSAAPAA